MTAGLLLWGPVLAGGAAMGVTAERVLGRCRGWKRRAALYLLLGAALVLPAWVGDHNPVLLFPPFLAVFLLCGGGSPLARLVTGGVFYTLLVPVSMLVDTLLEGATLPALDHGERPLFNLVKLACWVALVPVIWRLVPGPARLSARLWKLLGGLALAPLMATLSFSLWGTGLVEDELVDHFVEGIAYTVLPFASLSALALLAAMAVLSRHEALEEENRLAGLREVYYRGLRQEQAQVRALRHDMGNHLSALLGLLERGSRKEAEGYLRQLAGSPALTGRRRFCGNETVDVVLSSKAAALEETGLTADFQVSLPEQLDIPAPELCALLGNALDNAIEGAAGAEDRTVRLRARADKGLLMLRVENALGRPVKRGPDGSFLTTKGERGAHGFGLAGMEEIARRRGGSLEAEAADGRFQLTVCLPLEGD